MFIIVEHLRFVSHAQLCLMFLYICRIQSSLKMCQMTSLQVRWCRTVHCHHTIFLLFAQILLFTMTKLSFLLQQVQIKVVAVHLLARLVISWTCNQVLVRWYLWRSDELGFIVLNSPFVSTIIILLSLTLVYLQTPYWLQL